MTADSRIVLLRLMAGGYALGILVLGLIPMGPLPLPNTFVPQDKLMHASVFAGLTLLLSTLLSRAPRGAWAALGATAFGGLLELLQALVPYRSADWFDLPADAVGAAVAALVISVIFSVRSRAADPRSPVDR